MPSQTHQDQIWRGLERKETQTGQICDSGKNAAPVSSAVPAFGSIPSSTAAMEFVNTTGSRYRRLKRLAPSFDESDRGGDLRQFFGQGHPRMPVKRSRSDSVRSLWKIRHLTGQFSHSGKNAAPYHHLRVQISRTILLILLMFRQGK